MYICFLSGLGPETYVALLINIHFFFIVCVLTVVFSFFFMNCMAWIEDLSWAIKLVKLSCYGLELARFLSCIAWTGGARQIELLIFVDCLA